MLKINRERSNVLEILQFSAYKYDRSEAVWGRAPGAPPTPLDPLVDPISSLHLSTYRDIDENQMYFFVINLSLQHTN